MSPFERLASPGMDLAGLVGDGPVVEALDRVDLEVVLRGLLGCGWPVIGSDTAPVPIRRRAGAARGLTVVSWPTTGTICQLTTDVDNCTRP